MPAMDIPETGLSLCRDGPGNDPTVKPTQIMRLSLAQSTLDDIIQSLRNDQSARIRLGKHQTLYYGSKSQSFHSSPSTHRSEIYCGSSADKENLYFTGVLSHSLEVQKAKEATAATDQALANLEQSLNAFERGKESKKTHIITSVEELRALKTGDSRSSTGRQAALLARMPSSKVELEKDRLLKTNANRSLPSSPALGVSRSPASVPPLTSTSAPTSQNKDRLRLDALRVPFIHLLAVRAVSAKFLAKQTRSSLEDCTTLARKYGTENRINPEKFDLKDKVYRDLDVWSFPYPSQEDRQEAIENAISAFDRMRISRSDKLWQTLLPKEERGKGKCLSRLDLRTGPIKKPLTPRIQVQSPDGAGKDGYGTGHETDRASRNGLTPQTGEPTPAPKSATTTQKKKAAEKDVSKRPLVKSKTATNSTLTGRVTKKAERKTTAKPDGKFKSSEYVHDSDEDDVDMPDAPTPVSEKPKPQKAAPPAKPAGKQLKPSVPRESSHAPTPKVDPPRNPPPKAEASSHAPSKPSASKKLPSSQSSQPKSPQKPSSVDSSPRTNHSSDTQSRSRSSSQNNSSSSSSPLITQLARPNRASAVAPVSRKPIKANGIIKSTEAANPLKRKAELERTSLTPQLAGRTTGDLEHKRRRAVSTSSGSTGSASPPLSREILRQQLREKSQKFKQYYAKYRALHGALASQADPPRVDLDRLQRQHTRLQRMKKEIWDEDRRLRDGL